MTQPDDTERETIVGELRVRARLSYGSENLRLFFTGRRIIVAHVGKIGAGSLTGTSILGNLSAGFENAVQKGKESTVAKKTGALGPDQVLASDKNNFQIAFGDVVDVQVSGTPASSSIVLLTFDSKFEFEASQPLVVVKGLLSQVLSGRVRVTQRKQPY